MAGLAVRPFRFRVQPMRELIVQIVDFSRQVVAAVAIETGILALMTRLAPFRLVGSFVAMLKPPVGGMDIRQRHFALVTELTFVRSFQPVVTVHAGAHRRRRERVRRNTLCHTRMTSEAIRCAPQMCLVIERDPSLGHLNPRRLSGVAMTHPAASVL